MVGDGKSKWAEGCAIFKAWLPWKQTLKQSILEININERKREEAGLDRRRSELQA